MHIIDFVDLAGLNVMVNVEHIDAIEGGNDDSTGSILIAGREYLVDGPTIRMARGAMQHVISVEASDRKQMVLYTKAIAATHGIMST